MDRTEDFARLPVNVDWVNAVFTYSFGCITDVRLIGILATRDIKHTNSGLSLQARLVLVIVTLVMTARTQTMSFRYELASKGFSTEKSQHLVT